MPVVKEGEKWFQPEVESQSTEDGLQYSDVQAGARACTADLRNPVAK